jgi:hypothetical protein
MQRVAKRRTQLAFITSSSVRYAGRDRAIVVEVNPQTAFVRLLGTRTKYEFSWRGVFDYAARLTAERARADRQARRKRA